MKVSTAVVAAVIAASALSALAAEPPAFTACPKQTSGHTSDQPPAPVVVCEQLFPEPPFVRLPQDRHANGGETTMYGVVELDVAAVNFHIQNARFYDRNLKLYQLVTAAGQPLDEKSPLMKSNHLPSNRVHFLVYEAAGKVTAKSGSQSLELTALRPVVLLQGSAIDNRFLGAWEGKVSKRKGDREWYTDVTHDADFAPIRIDFAPPLVPTDNIGELQPMPKLKDGTRFKATGKFENATHAVRLSNGKCAPALDSYGAANPMPNTVAKPDYEIRMWRFPAMHTLWSKDFHIVFDYPKGLYPSATAMASEHNFRLKDYIATSTKPEPLTFRLHGNPIGQIVFVLEPVKGGGGPCK